MLRGDKVILRAVERDDVKRLHELSANVDLVLLSHGEWSPMSISAYEKHWEKTLGDDDPARFVIVADDEVIGSCGLHQKSRRDSTAAIGISIHNPDYIGKGYGRDALNVLVDWAFRIQNYRRLWLDALATNERAVRAYQSCGFVHEGLLRQHYYGDGQYHDAVVMGLLRTEWEARQNARASAM